MVVVPYHEGEAGDGGPGVGEGGASELELAEVAGEHDGDEGDAVVGHVGEDHGHREQDLVLGLLRVQEPGRRQPPSPALAAAALLPLLL